MQYVFMAILVAVVFAVCFFVDKGFTKAFRSKPQHKSGKMVRLSKRYASFGMILFTLGVGAAIYGASDGWALLVGGIFVALMGAGLIVYYMTCAIFYDEDSFLFMTLGKKTVTYLYSDIQFQQLYNNQGQLLIELYMADGKTVHVQSSMAGCFDFMDYAYAAWLRQTGRQEEDCPFHDPSNSCWFPPVEG